jgi:ATP-binding cassette, subfamily B, bacterial MsbA
MGVLLDPLRHFISVLLPGSAMARLIRRTALEEWPLLVASLLCNLLVAIFEGSTFVVIFQAARLLAEPPGPVAVVGPGPWAGAFLWLNGLPRGQLFLLLLTSALALQTLMGGARYLYGIAVGDFAARCQLHIAPAIHRYVLSLSYPCASRFAVGDLVHRVSLAPLSVQLELEQKGMVLSNLVLVVVYLGMLFSLSPLLSLVAIGMALTITAVQNFLRPRIHHLASQLAEVRKAIAIGITEDIQILRLLHSTASIDQAHQQLHMKMKSMEQRMRKLTRLIQVVEPVNDLLPIIAVVVIFLLSWNLFNGSTTLLIANLITFVAVLQRLNLRISRIAISFNRIIENGGAMDQLESLLDPSDKQFRRQGGLPYPGLNRSIRFEGVGLRYPDRPSLALEGIDLEICAGKTVALVGESGAGKSSLVDLLVGLQSPTEGKILVDGVDLCRVDLDSWQRRLGIVSQDVILLNTTIGKNIGFGMPEAGPEAIAVAAAKAGADSFIDTLPEGYDTVIGERGFRLSGGQRQRLSLARALLRDPEVLILDEATSALDSPTEERILEAIDAFARGRTVLTIAHRLSSVVHADLIVVMRAGRIVERGRHAELLERGGVYAGFWHCQIPVPPLRQGQPQLGDAHQHHQGFQPC